MKSAGDVQIENAFFEFNLRLHSDPYSSSYSDETFKFFEFSLGE